MQEETARARDHSYRQSAIEELRDLLKANCWDRHGGRYPNCDLCKDEFGRLYRLANKGAVEGPTELEYR